MTAILAGWLAFLPLAIATRDIWSQFVSVAIAGTAFIVACIPRSFRQGPAGPVVRISSWPVLARAPVFWAACALLAYAAIQTLNPAWEYVQNETVWWIRPHDHIRWLPSGVKAPFTRMNGWRQILIWSPPLLAASAAWLAITRRRAILALLTTIVVTGTVVVGLGVFQRANHTELIYGRFFFPGAVTFGTFVYKNHAAAYLLVAFVTSCGLALWHYLHGKRSGARSTPAPVFAFAAAAMAGGLAFSRSRIGIVLLALAALAFACGMAVILGSRRRHAVAAGASIALLGTVALALFHRDLDLDHLFAGRSARVHLHAAEVARRIFVDYRWTGVGAGGFRYLSPAYVRGLPSIGQDSYYDRDHAQVRTFAIDQAHNDYLQLLAAFGLVGGAIILSIFGCASAAVAARAAHRHPIGVAAAVAGATLAVYAALDFPLENAAVLGTTVLMLTVACRWTDIES